MIRINLALLKQANYVAVKTGQYTTATNKGGGGAINGQMAALLPLILRIMVPVALCAVAYFGYDFYIDQKTKEMAQENEVLDKEKVKVQDELKRIKGFEVVKAELDRNERIVRTKIETIEKLLKGRDGTVKTLIAVSQSLPKGVWLTDLISTEQGFQIKGGTTDIGLISDVMTHLGKTIYFKNVTLKNTQQDPNGKQATFELAARHE